MHFEEFEEHIVQIVTGCVVLNDDNLDISAKLEHIERGRESYQICKKHFNDSGNNLHRWLINQPLVFKKPVSDGYMELYIEYGCLETFYKFLNFCKMQNAGANCSEEYLAALAELIALSENN